MITYFRLTVLSLVILLCGCNPTIVQTEEITTTPEPQPEIIRQDYIILTEPWKQFFRGSPKILLMENPSKGILRMIEDQQKLIKAVLDTNSGTGESSHYAELTEKLDELKLMIPTAKKSSGYVPTSGRSYTYISGDTIYTRTGRYYDGYKYGVFRSKQKSSSPALVRSVEGLVHNATLELKDLNQRTEALKKLISQWNRRTAEMNPSGTSGIMRDANEAYLHALKNFTGNFIELRREVQKVEAAQAHQVANKSQIIAEWDVFEQNHLSILKDYLESNALETIVFSTGETYSIPEMKSRMKAYMVCKMGDRDLYFEVSTNRHELHPFVLVDVTPKQ